MSANIILFLKMCSKVTAFETWCGPLDAYPENNTFFKNLHSSIEHCNVFSAFQETLDVSFEIVYGSFSAFHPMT